jgi:hypothetical protein
VCKDMSNAVFELADSVRVGVEVTCPIPLPVKVTVGLEGVVAVNGDEKLDALGLSFHHELVQAVQYGVVIFGRRAALKRGKAVDRRSLPSARLAFATTN